MTEKAKSLLVLGFFALLFVIMWIVFIKVGAQQKRYDERQLINQGRAGRAAFLTVSTWEFLYFFASVLELKIPADDGFMVMLGVIVGIGVYVSICIFTDAYFPIDNSPNSSIVLFIIIGLMNIAISVARIVGGGYLTDGKLSYNSCNLPVGALLLTTGISALIRKAINRRTQESDGED